MRARMYRSALKIVVVKSVSVATSHEGSPHCHERNGPASLLDDRPLTIDSLSTS